MSEAAQLRKAWAAKGSPPCDHPEVDKEYYLGSSTGDKVCITCGEEVEERDRGRRNSGHQGE